MIESAQKWIEAGYHHFSIAGPDSLHVEKIAREIGLNKSGFYHHFVDRDSFLLELIDHHYTIMDQFNKDILLSKNFDPDYIDLIMKYKTAVFFQKQLRSFDEIPLFREAFLLVSEKNDKAIIPILIKYLKLPENHPLALELWGIFRDVFFMRTHPENTDRDHIRSLLLEFSGVIQILKRFPILPNNKGLKQNANS